MTDEALGSVFGAILFEALFLFRGIWWLYLPWGLVVIACILSVIPSRGGGTAVVYHDEPDAAKMAATLQRIERSRYSD